MKEFCSNCSCPNCTLIKNARKAKEDRANAILAAKETKAKEAEERKKQSKRLFLQECSAIWLLVNTAGNDQVKGQLIIQWIANAMDLSVGQVNTRRAEYAKYLSQRTQRIDGRPLIAEPRSWAMMPGSEGTELPDYCEQCGGMKTMGRKCKRCDIR